MKNLDNLQVIEKIDQSKMREIITNFAQQCAQAFQLGKRFLPPQCQVKNILFCAMGGSAIGAELVSLYLKKEIKIAVNVNRDYTLPKYVDKDCLVILISYSGNTEETLSAYAEAQKRQAKIIVISSGGKLSALAQEGGFPCLLIPSGLPPRQALGFVSLPILAILSQMGLIQDKEKEVAETIGLLKELEKDYLGIKIKSEINPAKKLAVQLWQKFCVIYADGGLAAVVTRWRGELAENSKMLASAHILPEMNHNEIMGWRHPRKLLKNFVAIFLRDEDEYPQVKKRIEISKEILQKEDIELAEVWSRGEGLLARLFSLIYIGDFTSFYLAILNGEDPTPVKRVEYLKQRLKEWG